MILNRREAIHRSINEKNSIMPQATSVSFKDAPPVEVPCRATAAQYGGSRYEMGVVQPGSSAIGKRNPHITYTGNSMAFCQARTPGFITKIGAMISPKLMNATTARRTEIVNSNGCPRWSEYPNAKAAMK